MTGGDDILYLITGTDISTSPLAPASGFAKKGLSGKRASYLTFLTGQVGFLDSHIQKTHQRSYLPTQSVSGYARRHFELA